eukprot:CAMPEP_0202949020 /NCGR_PEP_ID=MMETSP1395-20130829/14862_1 /ASSEMBLY_ACC=CAM_ASM_000871 /TAXON_ID=5961 /ORGANISM="Blepharisma japonicum, Strain Stock R1072" /LENGTH=743 /DNA_ID=CAMNT_0049651657 /DNA_START=12 /DNA_END=2243 /DNA_ORIENTATION=+
MANAVRDGMRSINENLVKNLFTYLETGVFANKTNDAYVRAYGLVLELADQDDNGKLLYDEYIKTIKDYTVKVVKTELSHLKGEALLTKLAWRWENHKILVYWMRKIFMYLDRYHVKNTQAVPLFQAGLNIFKSDVFDVISEQIRIALILQIHSEREGIAIDRNRVRECLVCFAQMGLTDSEIVKTHDKADDRDRLLWKGNPKLDLYERIFESPFLEDTKLYYASKSAGWMSSLSCPEYLREAKKVLEEEEERADRYLEPTTKPKLLGIIVEEVIVRNAQSLSEMPGTGCVDMFQHDKRDELKMMFAIFKRSENTLQHITSKMGPYIEKRGSAIVSDQQLQQDAIEYTKALLQFKNEIDTLVEYSFDNHSLFQRCRDMAFQNFMNKCAFSAPYIASYCDNEMRRGLKGVSEVETERRLDALIKLFVCLHDRDVFIRNYTRYLAKRLLDGTSISNDAEQTMIAKLKVECGNNIVSKISNMYQDIALSETVMNEFKALRHKGQPDGVQLSVQVLRSGCWPEQSSEACTLPQEIQGCTKKFTEFYMNKHQGRNLTWLLGFGTLEMGTLFSRKNYTCIVNPYQAAILLMFNHGNGYTVQQFREATRLSDNTLKAHLIMFFNPKMKLLNKESKGKTLDDDDLITINEDFQSQTLRVNYIPKKVKKTESSAKEDEIAITAERKNILDSVIVRIAKARRVIKHQELVTEVIRQVNHFRPQPQMIKTQIESLIQREFLARDENDRSIYNYIP